MVTLTKAAGGAKSAKKQRKFGRNKKWCEVYRTRGMREINKAKRLRRHLKKHPNDKQVAT